MRECGRAKGGEVNEAEALGDVPALEGVVGFDGARVRPGVRPQVEGLVTDDWMQMDEHSAVEKR